ncbi:MAG: hypothetical protein MHM6MM_004904 [Cercozoa sp. M6MM]
MPKNLIHALSRKLSRPRERDAQGARLEKKRTNVASDSETTSEVSGTLALRQRNEAIAESISSRIFALVHARELSEAMYGSAPTAIAGEFSDSDSDFDSVGSDHDARGSIRHATTVALAAAKMRARAKARMKDKATALKELRKTLSKEFHVFASHDGDTLVLRRRSPSTFAAFDDVTIRRRMLRALREESESVSTQTLRAETNTKERTCEGRFKSCGTQTDNSEYHVPLRMESRPSLKKTQPIRKFSKVTQTQLRAAFESRATQMDGFLVATPPTLRDTISAFTQTTSLPYWKRSEAMPEKLAKVLTREEEQHRNSKHLSGIRSFTNRVETAFADKHRLETTRISSLYRRLSDLRQRLILLGGAIAVSCTLPFKQTLQ